MERTVSFWPAARATEQERASCRRRLRGRVSEHESGSARSHTQLSAGAPMSSCWTQVPRMQASMVQGSASSHAPASPSRHSGVVGGSVVVVVVTFGRVVLVVVGFGRVDVVVELVVVGAGRVVLVVDDVVVVGRGRVVLVVELVVVVVGAGRVVDVVELVDVDDVVELVVVTGGRVVEVVMGRRIVVDVVVGGGRRIVVDVVVVVGRTMKVVLVVVGTGHRMGWCTQPWLGSQVSRVQSFRSSHRGGMPRVQRPSEQPSAPLQGFPSSHSLPSVQPVGVGTQSGSSTGQRGGSAFATWSVASRARAASIETSVIRWNDMTSTSCRATTHDACQAEGLATARSARAAPAAETVRIYRPESPPDARGRAPRARLTPVARPS